MEKSRTHGKRSGIAPVETLVAPDEHAILMLLAEHKGLTSTQIWKSVHPDKFRTHTLRTLARLRERGMVSSEALEPHLGQASLYVWRLLKAGARAINVPHGDHFYRRASKDIVQHRGLILELCRQVNSVEGWRLIRPQQYNCYHPRPDATPQALQVADALLHLRWSAEARFHEAQERFDSLRINALPTMLGAEIEVADYRKRELTTLVVPPYINDYIAYLSGDAKHTVILVPHPPRASRQFWTRNNPPKGKHAPGRIEIYRRIAKILPVVAVFDDDATDEARALAEVIKPAGLRVFLVSGIAGLLRRILD